MALFENGELKNALIFDDESRWHKILLNISKILKIYPFKIITYSSFDSFKF